MTVEPVVVMPDIASKKASAKLRLRPAKAKGRAANTVRPSQLAVVRTNASRMPTCISPPRMVRISDTPMNKVRPAEAANTCQSRWPVAASTSAGSTIAIESVVSRTPRMNRIGRKSSTLEPHGRCRVRYSLAGVAVEGG